MARWMTFGIALLFPGLVFAQAEPIPFSSLKNIQGKTISVDSVKDSPTIVFFFLGTECPISNAYIPRLVEIHKKYSAKGVVFFAIHSNDHETFKDLASHAKQFKLPFVTYRDEKQKLADHFKVERVPAVVVLDRTRKVRYQGRIDDQFGIGYQRPSAKRHFLVEALDAVLDGNELANVTVPVEGCKLTRAPRPKSDAAFTYAKHISRIIQNHCQECHRPGQIGPMPFTSYDEVSAWSPMIREVVSDRRMPPWHADPKHGKFSNDMSLSKESRDMLLTWIDEGCAKGNEADLPPSRKFPEAWAIGEPDAVYKMPTSFTVPAKAPKGGVPYKYFLVNVNNSEELWVQAAEAKPGNRSVVHHIIVYAVEKGTKRREGGDGVGGGMLVAYAPGDVGVRFPPGSAKKLPKNAVLVFQMHYTPNGVEQADQSSVALIFSKTPPTTEVRTRGIAQRIFLLPPNTDDTRVISSSKLAEDAILYGLFPHMHLRGKSFQYVAHYPNGNKEILLSVPRYDFGWQTNYRLAEPKRMPAGTKIECVAFFDNSENNPNNPDPTKWVHWGDQTWEEMMIGFIDYAYVRAMK